MEDSMLQGKLIFENERAHNQFWGEIDRLNQEKIRILESVIEEVFSISKEEVERRNLRVEEIDAEKEKLKADFEKYREEIKKLKSVNVLGEIMGVEQASSIWGLSPERIKHLCADGKVKSIKIGKTWIIDQNQDNPSARKNATRMG